MVNTPFPTVKEPTSHQTRIMLRSPKNEPGSGAGKRAGHPGNHSARRAYGGGGAAGGGRNARAGAFRPAVDPEHARALAERAGGAPGREPAVDVDLHHRDGGSRLGPAQLT